MNKKLESKFKWQCNEEGIALKLRMTRMGHEFQGKEIGGVNDTPSKISLHALPYTKEHFVAYLSPPWIARFAH